MLPAPARIRRGADFDAVVRHGRRATTDTVVVHARQRSTSGIARGGFVVNRGVGGAVTRNAVRRRLRHALADRLGELPPGVDVVVRAQPAAAHTAGRRLRADLDAALARAIRGPAA